MKGILLAAGSGTRMYPLTLALSKHLLPVYDKPLIYYPLATLMQAGIRDILIIVTPDEAHAYAKLLGDGARFGLRLRYAVQTEPRGIADAFRIGADFLNNEPVCLALGDNIFYGPSLAPALAAARENDGATVFAYALDDPRPFGVIELDEDGRPRSIEEKPMQPRSNLVIPGLYFYDREVAAIAKSLRPSARGELEIAAVNNAYLRQKRLHAVRLAPELLWFDAGGAESLLAAANRIRDIQRQSGKLVACLEEIAFRHGYISLSELRQAGERLRNSAYGAYLLALCAAAAPGVV